MQPPKKIKAYRRELAVRSAARWTGNGTVRTVTDSGPRTLRGVEKLSTGRETVARLTKYEARESLRQQLRTPAYRDNLAFLEKQIGATLDFEDLPPNEQAYKAGHGVARIVALNGAGIQPSAVASGFLVAPDLLLTNHHVFRSLDEARGTAAQFDYEHVGTNVRTGTLFELDPDRFFVNDLRLDYALVAVKPRALDGADLRTYQFLPLIATEGKIRKGDPCYVIQHPDGQPKTYVTRNSNLTELLDDGFLLYTADTLAGSSGSPVFNAHWETIALHHCGVPEMRDGQLVTVSGELVPANSDIEDDQLRWVANEGARVSALVQSLAQQKPGDQGQQRILADLLATTTDPLRIAVEMKPASSASATPIPDTMAQNIFNITGNVTINITGNGAAPIINTQQPAQLTAPRIGLAPEKALEFDDDYENRKGYDPEFLGGTIPLPTVVAERKNELLMESGSTPWVIPYHHFSLVMNKDRRLCMWTAANVDYNADKRDDRGRSAFGSESWRLDPRVAVKAPKLQVVDADFYKPATKIDRGHIVRREDNCWGDDTDGITYANSDTYHWTNCTPQHEAFNQEKEKGIWGQFESHIQREVNAVGNRMIVLAGPVLATDDPVKEYPRGPLQVPMRFWKVVACVSEDNGDPELLAYGFVFDQSEPIRTKGYERMDMGDYEINQRSLAFITEISGVVFAAVLMESDVLKGTRGEEKIVVQSRNDVRLQRKTEK